MRDVVIAGYLRTAQSQSRPTDPDRDWFGKMRTDDMLSKLLPEVLNRAQIKADEVDDYIVGCAQGIGENFTLGGRTPILLANLDKRTASKMVDEQCGSAMAAAHIGFMEIAMGFADVVLCSGMEHMTRVPMGGDGAIEVNPRLFLDPAMRHWDPLTVMNMGLTAEKLAVEGNLSREEMDAFAAQSHQLATKAAAEGFFKDEILPISVLQANGSEMLVDKDQGIRTNATAESMGKLRAAYKLGGSITAGNASPLNAGASTLLLMSKELAERKGLKPMARIVSIGFAGVEPDVMGKGPVPATIRALKSAGLKADDIDFWEINEAFSAVALYTMNEFKINPDKVNIKGGGAAIGHPLGATGCRIIGTLARILEIENGRYGCATMCCGGGQGVSTIIERIAN